MPLLLKTHYKLAKKSIKRNRSRSMLTCLGISIGVASIVLILSLMNSISNLVKTQVGKIGEGLIVVRPDFQTDRIDSVVNELTNSIQYKTSNLSLKNVEKIKQVQNVSAAAPIALSTNTIKIGDKAINSVNVIATTPDFLKIQDFPLHNGTFLTESTNENSAVMGYSLAMQLLGNAEGVGKTVEILGQKFIIVGILAEVNDPINFNNIDLDSSIIINTNFFTNINSTLQISQINVKIKETASLEETKEQISQAVKSANSGDTNFKVLSGEEITHPASSFLTTVTGILSLVAGISLVVGGIGIMNIMLVSVAERTREIGIRKSVGATSKNIFGEFLFESLILSVTGSFFGFILGYILAFIIRVITPFTPYISIEIIIITFAISILTGVVFGLVPALKASKKDPIISLKYY